MRWFLRTAGERDTERFERCTVVGEFKLGEQAREDVVVEKVACGEGEVGQVGVEGTVCVAHVVGAYVVADVDVVAEGLGCAAEGGLCAVGRKRVSRVCEAGARVVVGETYTGCRNEPAPSRPMPIPMKIMKIR